MNLWQNFLRPTTVADALLALRDAPAPTAAIAGGTDLLLDLDQGRHPPTDHTRGPDVGRRNAATWRFAGNAFSLARLLSLTAIARNPLDLEACSARWWKRATSSVARRSAMWRPWAEMWLTRCLPQMARLRCLALDATVEIADLHRSRQVPLAEVFAGPGKSTLQSGQELLVGFLHAAGRRSGEASAFNASCARRAWRLPILNLAVWVRRKGDQSRTSASRSGPQARRRAEHRAPRPRCCGSAFTIGAREAAVDGARLAVRSSEPAQGAPLLSIDATWLATY